MAKYTVMSSVGEGKEFMNGIEFDYVIEDEEIGKKVKCLGGDFTITQNGKILVLSNPDWVLTIMKQPEPEEEEEKFEVNKDYDIFFETKTFKIHDTPVTRKGVTYKQFFETVRDEWKNVEKIRPSEPFPMKFNYDFNSLVFTHDWKFEGDDFKYLKEGSWGRETADGRSF